MKLRELREIAACPPQCTQCTLLRHGPKRNPHFSRKGRRSTILLPAPPGLEDVVEERKAKYIVWLESDEDDSSSEDESSSDE